MALPVVPALAAGIVTALAWAMKFLIVKAMLALGLQIVTFVGIDFTLDWILNQIMSNLDLMSNEVYTIVRICRIPDAVSVISAATMTRYSLVYGFGKLMFLAGRQA